jgi:hypothetical protein
MQNPLVTPLPDGKTWRLEEDYILDLNNGQTVFIPKGFKFDFASIPRLFWRLFPPATGKHRLAALVHDWLCASMTVSWTEAACVFLKVMEWSNVPSWKRYSMYYAVKTWGLFKSDDIPTSIKLIELQNRRIAEADKVFHGNII